MNRAVTKPRLGGAHRLPPSRVVRVTKRPTPTGVGKSVSLAKAPKITDSQCRSRRSEEVTYECCAAGSANPVERMSEQARARYFRTEISHRCGRHTEDEAAAPKFERPVADDQGQRGSCSRRWTATQTR